MINNVDQSQLARTESTTAAPTSNNNSSISHVDRKVSDTASDIMKSDGLLGRENSIADHKYSATLPEQTTAASSQAALKILTPTTSSSYLPDQMAQTTQVKEQIITQFIDHANNPENGLSYTEAKAQLEQLGSELGIKNVSKEIGALRIPLTKAESKELILAKLESKISKQPMSIIYAVNKRLITSEEAKGILSQSGKQFYLSTINPALRDQMASMSAAEKRDFLHDQLPNLGKLLKSIDTTDTKKFTVAINELKAQFDTVREHHFRSDASLEQLVLNPSKLEESYAEREIKSVLSQLGDPSPVISTPAQSLVKISTDEFLDAKWQAVLTKGSMARYVSVSSAGFVDISPKEQKFINEICEVARLFSQTSKVKRVEVLNNFESKLGELKKIAPQAEAHLEGHMEFLKAQKSNKTPSPEVQEKEKAYQEATLNYITERNAILNYFQHVEHGPHVSEHDIVEMQKKSAGYNIVINNDISRVQSEKPAFKFLSQMRSEKLEAIKKEKKAK